MFPSLHRSRRPPRWRPPPPTSRPTKRFGPTSGCCEGGRKQIWKSIFIWHWLLTTLFFQSEILEMTIGKEFLSSLVYWKEILLTWCKLNCDELYLAKMYISVRWNPLYNLLNLTWQRWYHRGRLHLEVAEGIHRRGGRPKNRIEINLKVLIVL